jgi:uncharacterized protein
MKTKGIVAFLILAFGLAWVLWEIPIRMGVPVTAPLFQLFVIPGTFAPAIAAFIVRAFITREGFSDVGLGLGLRCWRWYLFGLVLPLFVMAAVVLEASVLGIAQPDFSVPVVAKAFAAKHLGVPAPIQLNLIIIGQCLITSLIATPLLFGEEFGWRGYLQPRLFADRPALSALFTGLIWGVWHYPLIFRGYDYGDQPLAGAAVLLVSTTLLSYIFAWLVRRTGSIWSASLAHAATNVLGVGLSTFWFSTAHKPVMTSYLGLLACLPLALICLVLMAMRDDRTRSNTWKGL